MASIEFDHVGVVVNDLEATAQFFVDLGRAGLVVDVAEPLRSASA
jgi:catechol 2,3-dioxygenase-like lactoylglutathione lyase family enzyme